jgi:hypothetical protein
MMDSTIEPPGNGHRELPPQRKVVSALLSATLPTDRVDHGQPLTIKRSGFRRSDGRYHLLDQVSVTCPLQRGAPWLWSLSPLRP